MIRIFSVPDGHKLYSFKRGMAKAGIFSLAFNNAGTLLGLTSTRGTIHVFQLVQDVVQDKSKSPAITSLRDRM